MKKIVIKYYIKWSEHIDMLLTLSSSFSRSQTGTGVIIVVCGEPIAEKVLPSVDKEFISA